MYYILTDKNDMVSYEYYSILKGKYIKVKYKCTTGLNIAKKNEEYHVLTSNSLLNRRYTPDPSNCYYLRYAKISVKSDITDSDIVEKGMIKTNCVILSDRYYLYDPRIIKKFNIKVDQYMIFGACCCGDIKFLEWWKNFRLSSASVNGHIHSSGLKWLANSGLDIVYDHGILKYAFRYIHIHDVHINAIKWLKYNNFMVRLSRKHKVYYDVKNRYDSIKEKIKNFKKSLKLL